MAGHEWEDWFEREELIGQISDIRVQNLQVERENVQKRTFTRWINLHLEKCDPPMEVHDLFRDIQDGRILMALLEELSGCKLLHGWKKSSHRIFRLNNIAKVLSFLEERNVKLVSIDASDVADGNSSIVLGLIWNIILFFQIKELTGNIRSQFPSSSSLSSIPTSSDSDASLCSTPSEERRAPASDGRAIRKLLQWVQKRTRKYGVAVKDFGKSWSSGLAFLAVIKAIDPSLVDMRRAMLRSPRDNLEDAFRTAHYSLGIARLLEPEDVTINPPDEQSIMTYVSQFLEHFPDLEEPAEEPSQVIERSVSMGRLSAHDSEADMRRNGVHRSRLKERPYPPAHKDCVQPPPKIFISVLGDRRGGRSPASLPSRTRAWASEDSLVDPIPGEDDSAGVIAEEPPDARQSGVFTVVGSESPRSSYVESVISSSETESAVLVDSAIGSPDSWVGSEVLEAATPERFAESRSDQSLCDSGVAWDVGAPSADTPEDVTALGEGQMAGGKPQDRSLPELFIDEGVYSLSSMESTQDRIQECSERDDELENLHIQDLGQNGASKDVPVQIECENKGEMDSEQVDVSPLHKDLMSDEKQASLGISEVPQQPDSGVGHSLESEGTYPAQSGFEDKPLASDICEEPQVRDDVVKSTDGESECAKEMVEGSNDNEGQSHVENKMSVDERSSSVVFETTNVCQRNESVSEVDMEELGVLKEINKDPTESVKSENETSHGLLNGHLCLQEDAGAHIDDIVDDTLPVASLAAECPSANEDGVSESHLDPGSTHLTGPQTGSTPDEAPDRGTGTHGPEIEDQARAEDLHVTVFSRIHSYEMDVSNAGGLSEFGHDSGEQNPSKSIKCALCRNGGLMASLHQTVGTENGHFSGATNLHDPVNTSNTDSLVSEAVDVEINGSQQKCGDHASDIGDRASDIGDRASDIGDHASDIGGDTRVPLLGLESPGLHSDQETTTNRATDLLDGHSDTLEATSSSTDEPATDDAGDHDVPLSFFLTNPDRSPSPLVELDPMDLFYPDSEAAMFTEPPPEAEESHVPVFSVLALQPAPVSESPPDMDFLQETYLHQEAQHTPHELGEVDFRNTSVSSTQWQQVTDSDGSWLAGGEEDTAGTSVQPESKLLLLGQYADLTPAAGTEVEGQDTAGGARANTEAMSSGAKSISDVDEGLTCTVLRRRKGAASTESKDNQRDASASKVHSNGSDHRRRENPPEPTGELYLLLLLWMLLYCVWLLPQMDLQALPSLLFNMEH